MSMSRYSFFTRTTLGLACVALVAPSAAHADPADKPAEPAKEAAAEPEKAPDAEPEKAGPKLLVLPYQPIFRTVEQDKALKVTKFLNDALSEDVVVIRGGVADANAKSPSLADATEAAKAAAAAEAANDIEGAIAKRKAVLAAMEANASALDNADQYVAAMHLLARALMWSGDDKGARDIMADAARMSPGFTLDPTQYSRLYRKWFLAEAKKVVKDKAGELLVKSVLPGATILLDGREMGVAPVLLEQAVPGKHLLGAEVEGVPAYKAIVEVKPGNKTEYRVTFGGTVGGAEVGEVTDAISINKVSKDAVKAAVQAGKNAGAEYVVAGGMSRGDNNFKTHTFVVEVKTGKMQPLEVVDIDFELLTAEADIIRAARQIEAAMKAFDKPKPVIAMIDAKVSGSTTITRVDARPDTSALKGKRTRKTPRTKDGSRRVFKAIKGGSVEIKDD